jgi:hypothetical protein
MGGSETSGWRKIRIEKENVMAEQSRPIEDLVKTLGPEQQEAVRRFIEGLLPGRGSTPAPELAFRWAGALSDMRERFTSVELQHALLDARTERP